MRKLTTTLLAILISVFVIAQTPNAFKYQTVVRNATGTVLNNQNVDFKISILETSVSGSAVYVETFSTTTNQFGLVNLEIGKGTVAFGNFSTINWSGDINFVKIEADIFDGNGLQNMGTSQLLSVPYALNAKTAENVFSGDYNVLTNKPVLAGDVTGATGATKVEKIQGLDVSANSPADGQILKWNSAQSKWIPNDDALGAPGSTDGVVSSMGILGSATKTITLDRTNGLGQLTVSFVDSVNDADADATNELQTLNQTGTTVTLSNSGGSISVADNDNNSSNELQTLNQTGTTVTLSNSGGSISVADNDNDSSNEIQGLDLTGNTLTITNNSSVTNIDLSGYVNLWQESSNDIYYNGGNVGVGVSNPDGKLIVQADAGMHVDTAIFEVKNKNGKTIFAVYEEGVRVYVDDSGTKSNSSKAGFAVGGFNATKAITNEYFRVTPDSVRVYIESGSGSTKAGFAVGGFNATKSTPDMLLNIGASDSSDVINPSEPRIAWYPLKEAFMAGRVLIESADSVGTNSFATGNESRALGDYSQALGFHARAKGNNSTAIGNYANAVDSGSYAMGSGATATGLRSFALGSTGVDSTGASTNPTKASGDYSYAFGMGAIASGQGALALGVNTTASGSYSLANGYDAIASATNGIAIGKNTNAYRKPTEWLSGYSLALGFNCSAQSYSKLIASNLYNYSAMAIGVNSDATGQYSIAIGNNAKATGYRSVALGNNISVSGSNSFGINLSNTSVAMSSDDVFSIMGGSVGIGTTNPSATLQVSNPGTGNSFIVRDGFYTRLVINDDGRVGIGDSSPTYKLELPNNTSSGTGKARATQWVTYSDKRVKSKGELLVNGINTIMSIKPLSYKHYSSTFENGELIVDKTNFDVTVGMFAQDLYKVFPPAVEKPEDESIDYWAVDYEKLIPVLIKATQEQQEIIVKIENQNTELKKDNTEQKEIINELIKRIEKLENK